MLQKIIEHYKAETDNKVVFWCGLVLCVACNLYTIRDWKPYEILFVVGWLGLYAGWALTAEIKTVYPMLFPHLFLIYVATIMMLCDIPPFNRIV